MAEARSAVSYRAQPANLSFEVTDNEIVFRLSKNAVPSLVTSVTSSATRRLIRVRNIISNALYPYPAWQWAALAAAPAALMLTEHGSPASAPEAVRSVLDAARHHLDRMEDWLPKELPREVSVGAVALATGTAAVLLMSYTRKALLRALLHYQGWIYDTKGTSTTTMIWGVLVQLLSGHHMFKLLRPSALTYSNQSSLPRLPVPALADTCRRYLASVQPILSPEEFSKMETLCADFERHEGRRLQRYCVAKSWVTPNYVTDWWEKYVYLNGRDPIVVNSNYYILDLKAEPPTHRQAARTASVVWRCLDVKYKLDREQYAPMVVRGTVPMCMWQFERTFSTTRIPGVECDTLRTFPESKHIAVLRRGHWYTVEVLDGAGSRPIAPRELEIQFNWIIDHADRHAKPPTEAEASIAALTADNRTEWAKVRSMYFSSHINASSLAMIESSIFVVALEHETPTDLSSTARSLFHGDGRTRWADKSFMLITYPNGRMGLHCEHSWADAPVIGFVVEMSLQVGEYMEKDTFFTKDGHCAITGPLRPRAPPTPLMWDFSMRAEEAIMASFARAQNLVSDVELEVVVFSDFGKGFIKQCRVSPDAFLQMALQLAYFRESQGQFVLTYESSMTRLFLHGRTETVRPVTHPSANFVRAFFDPAVSNKERIRLLSLAADNHQNLYRDAMTGKGVDRHLFALYVMSKGLNVRSPFLEAALSMKWKLSTSQQPQNQTGMLNLRKYPDLLSYGGGFGPVTDDGYGVSYMVADDDGLSFHISCKRSCPDTDSRRFAAHLIQSLRELRQMFEDAKNE